MNFDFSDDLKALRDQARKFLRERDAKGAARRVLDAGGGHDKALWQEIAQMGWIGAAIPEEHGGAGLGHLGLCVLAEELGYTLAPVPFASTAYLATEAIMMAGSAAQKQRWLPQFASGAAIGTLALAEGPGAVDAKKLRATISNGRLIGTKLPVPDGATAHLAVVAARSGERAVSLFLVDLAGSGVR